MSDQPTEAAREAAKDIADAILTNMDEANELGRPHYEWTCNVLAEAFDAHAATAAKEAADAKHAHYINCLTVLRENFVLEHRNHAACAIDEAIELLCLHLPKKASE